MTDRENIVGNAPCPGCRKIGRDRTGNHLILFKDGGAACMRCGYAESRDTFTKPTETLTGDKPPEQVEKEIDWILDNSVTLGMKERGLKAFACKHFGVRTGLSLEDGKTPVCVYLPIIGEDKEVQGYRVKTPDKRMWCKGTGKKPLFFGADVAPPKGNKLFITEGQEDAIALYQAMYEHIKVKWRKRIAVVSLQNGSGSADKEILRNKQLIDGYKEIVLCFDMDEAGREAVDKVLTVLPRDKVWVASYQEKDANDMVKAGLSRDLYFNCIQPNKPRPEKIISGSDISLEELMVPLKEGIQTHYPGLNEKLHGFRYGEGAGELTVFCAGTGMGKTTLAREIMYDFNARHGLTLGHIFLEEQYKKTGQSYVAIDNNVPLAALRADPSIISKEAWNKSYHNLINNGRCHFMKHWGSIDSSELMDYMWYLSKVCKCGLIMLDHISLVVSGQESSGEGERKDLDILMTKLAAFCEESGTSVVAIVHLKRPSHGSFNEGTQISLRDLRGSAAIEQLSHNVIAIEGDQQGNEPNQRWSRVLKNREWGDLGIADYMQYYPETGRLLPERLGGLNG